ncbi:MAG: hypothetical protein DMF33_04450 [Verrucomicrobia bacterium]|nr:MAG: hypothetical protein DMF33_04450 [Verrucomicrobiota bacterium]
MAQGIVATAGTRCARLAASSTSLPAVASAKVGDLDNPIASALRPSLRTSLKNHDLHAIAKASSRKLEQEATKKTKGHKKISKLTLCYLRFLL